MGEIHRALFYDMETTQGASVNSTSGLLDSGLPAFGINRAPTKAKRTVASPF